MAVFESHSFENHEEVIFCNNAHSGLKAIIAIHNTSRGPALGGCRVWPYKNSETALEDVLRLSKGMTYKAAMADLPYGGGKSVIIGDTKTLDRKAIFLAMAEFINHLGGRYITAEDVGSTVNDMETMLKRTAHVVGTKTLGNGDPSPATAYGVFTGLKASVKHRLQKESLQGVKIAVQGLGHVGKHLCESLFKEGAELYVSDLSEDNLNYAAEKYNAKPVKGDTIYSLDVDVFAPCALGGILNDKTLNNLKAKVIAGAANNQLEEAYHGDKLAEMDILYAPDYVLNAGGLINVYYERQGYDQVKAYAHIDKMHDTLIEIFEYAKENNLSTAKAADIIAEKRFQKHKTA